jgi:hypothetical protein
MQMRVEKKKHLPIDSISHAHNSELHKSFIPIVRALSKKRSLVFYEGLFETALGAIATINLFLMIGT